MRADWTRYLLSDGPAPTWSMAVSTAESFGLKVDEGFRGYGIDAGAQYRGDGVLRTEVKFYEGNPEAISNIFHEVGHWLVASLMERRMLNFGCGEGPEDGVLKLWGQSGSEKEKPASMMGVLLELSHGCSAIGTLTFHSWIAEDRTRQGGFCGRRSVFQRVWPPCMMKWRWMDSDVRQVLQWLVDCGLVDKDLKPVVGRERRAA